MNTITSARGATDAATPTITLTTTPATPPTAMPTIPPAADPITDPTDTPTEADLVDFTDDDLTDDDLTDDELADLDGLTDEEILDAVNTMRGLRGMPTTLGPPDAAEARDPTEQPMLGSTDLPGPLSLSMLAEFGSMTRLDSHNGYPAQSADTLYGRARIIGHVAPRNTVACILSAAWIWLGGLFPKSIDVISQSHYRTSMYGRAIRVFNRKAHPDHVISIGDTRVTTPVRTACDIALLPEKELHNADSRSLISRLMLNYRFTPDECVRVLGGNSRFWSRVPFALKMLEDVRAGIAPAGS